MKDVLRFLTMQYVKQFGRNGVLIEVTTEHVADEHAIEFLEQLDRGNVFGRDIFLDIFALRHAAPEAHEALRTFAKTVTSPILNAPGERALWLTGGWNKRGPEWDKTKSLLFQLSEASIRNLRAKEEGGEHVADPTRNAQVWRPNSRGERHPYRSNRVRWGTSGR